MNVNLAYYSFADNKFYEPLDVLNADITIFKAVSSACSNEYEIYESGIYLCATSKLKMPKQGWKIHISASYDNAIHILNIVAKELVLCSFFSFAVFASTAFATAASASSLDSLVT